MFVFAENPPQMCDPWKSVRESLLDSLAILGVGLDAALSTAADSNDATVDVAGSTDPDFERWLHDDPMVSGNPASRYGEDAPGYVTGNGLGSLEICAAED